MLLLFIALDIVLYFLFLCLFCNACVLPWLSIVSFLCHYKDLIGLIAKLNKTQCCFNVYSVQVTTKLEKKKRPDPFALNSVVC